MVNLLLLVLFLIPGWSQVDLRPGDILLQPLDCSVCTLIEEEEESIFSHIGMVIATTPEIMVAEAYGKVKAIPLKSFFQKTQKNQRISVIRFQDDNLLMTLNTRASELLPFFQQHYDGKKYDAQFLWDDEKLYCSELITKFFEAFLSINIPLKRMHFEKNRDKWARFFKGQIPDGEWGISPGDFERSPYFEKIGEF